MRRAAIAVAVSLSTPALAVPVSLSRFLAEERPAPDASIAYGASPAQGIDVYLPKTKGPHPVAILVHGGCWMKGTAGREQLRAAGRDLAGRGIAVWSIGSRRADEEGGGYPGTFEDVAKAIDLLPANASKYELDVSRVVAVGHSAGAHLALWAASRPRLPKASPLSVADPFPLRTVIGLGGVGDLERAAGIASVCGPSILPALVGHPSASRPDVYADTSPSKLLPVDAQVLMITGAEDDITPTASAKTYVDEVKAAGGTAELVIVPDAAHFDVVTTGTPAWRLVSERIAAALR